MQPTNKDSGVVKGIRSSLSILQFKSGKHCKNHNRENDHSRMTTYYDILESAWRFHDHVKQRRTEDAKWTPAEESVLREVIISHEA